MSFEAMLFLLVAVWSLPLFLLAALVVRYWLDVRRDARLYADIVAAGASPVQARVLLTLVREERG